MKRQIFKVQRPIESNMADPPWIIYNKMRSHDYQLSSSLVPDSLKRIMGSSYKVYVEAEVDTGGTFSVYKRAPNQSW